MNNIEVEVTYYIPSGQIIIEFEVPENKTEQEIEEIGIIKIVSEIEQSKLDQLERYVYEKGSSIQSSEVTLQMKFGKLTTDIEHLVDDTDGDIEIKATYEIIEEVKNNSKLKFLRNINDMAFQFGKKIPKKKKVKKNLM